MRWVTPPPALTRASVDTFNNDAHAVLHTADDPRTFKNDAQASSRYWAVYEIFPPPACTAKICVFFFYTPTGRPRRKSLPLECHRNATTRTCSVSRAKSDSRRPSRSVVDKLERRQLLRVSEMLSRHRQARACMRAAAYARVHCSVRGGVRERRHTADASRRSCRLVEHRLQRRTDSVET